MGEVAAHAERLDSKSRCRASHDGAGLYAMEVCLRELWSRECGESREEHRPMGVHAGAMLKSLNTSYSYSPLYKMALNNS
jgi:hypothetical protein